MGKDTEQLFDKPRLERGGIVKGTALQVLSRFLTTTKEEPMVHIDKYTVNTIGTKWNKGKPKKNQTLMTLHSEECIQGREFLDLLSEVIRTQHHYRGTDVHFNVTITENQED